MFDIIKKLAQTYGPSGNEKKVADAIIEMVKGKVD